MNYLIKIVYSVLFFISNFFVLSAKSQHYISPKQSVYSYRTAFENKNERAFFSYLVEVKDFNPSVLAELCKRYYLDNSISKIFLALCYIEGYLVHKNVEKGIFILEGISEKDSLVATYILGNVLLKQSNQDNKAVKLLQQSALLGHVKSQEQLAHIYCWSLFCNNSEKFIYWAEIAASHNSHIACVMLRNEYRAGNVIQKDLDKAIYWGEQAVRYSNSMDDVFCLASLYYENRNYAKALHWFQISASKGDDLSIRMIKVIHNKVNSTGIVN